MGRRRRTSGVTALALAGALVLAVVALVHARRAATEPVTTPGAGASSPPLVLEANATVVRAIDGDTVDLDIDGHRERIRLIGVNTPETVDPRRPVECYGPEAKAYTKSLLHPGTPVLLERDVEPRDDYGRLLGYIRRATDGLFVNLELVWQGYAEPLTIEPNTAHAPEFLEAARAAERAGRGLWSACAG